MTAGQVVHALWITSENLVFIYFMSGHNITETSMCLKMASNVLRLPDIGFPAYFLISFRDNCPEIGAIRKHRFDDVDKKLIFIVGDTDGSTFHCFLVDFTCGVMLNWFKSCRRGHLGK